MKKCPFCAEEIQDEAIKCKHCGSMLDNKQKAKWYFKTSSLVVTFLCFGPFVLPLIWLNPRFSIKAKLIISGVVIALSYFATVAVLNSLKSITCYYKTIL